MADSCYQLDDDVREKLEQVLAGRDEDYQLIIFFMLSLPKEDFVKFCDAIKAHPKGSKGLKMLVNAFISSSKRNDLDRSSKDLSSEWKVSGTLIKAGRDIGKQVLQQAANATIDAAADAVFKYGLKFSSDIFRMEGTAQVKHRPYSTKNSRMDMKAQAECQTGSHARSNSVFQQSGGPSTPGDVSSPLGFIDPMSSMRSYDLLHSSIFGTPGQVSTSLTASRPRSSIDWSSSLFKTYGLPPNFG